MQSQIQPQEANDRIIAALSYILSPILSIVILVTDMKNKPFLKYHAYQSLVFGIAPYILASIAGLLMFVVVGCFLLPVLMILPFVYGYMAYSKGIFTIPVVTDLTRNFFKDFPSPSAM